MEGNETRVTRKLQRLECSKKQMQRRHWKRQLDARRQSSQLGEWVRGPHQTSGPQECRSLWGYEELWDHFRWRKQKQQLKE